MQSTRKLLGRLGWPVDALSDRQITTELYRRWFAGNQEDPDDEAPLSVASAGGIIVAMASEGNLDALCWSQDGPVPPDGAVPAGDAAIFRPRVSSARVSPERRRSPREPARDLVRWRRGPDDAVGCTGWLVDRSAEGMAFISPAAEAPQPGDEIIPCIHGRDRGRIEAGPAAVVRAEPLNDELTLVCARLLESTWPD